MIFLKTEKYPTPGYAYAIRTLKSEFVQEMEGEGGEKAFKHPLVNAASEMEDEGRKALKRFYEDLVHSVSAITGREAHVKGKRGKRPCEDPDQSFVELATAASGSEAEVSEGSIFKILACRKALKYSCKEDLVNSASSTTVDKKALEGHCEDRVDSAPAVASGKVKRNLPSVASSSSTSATPNNYSFGCFVQHGSKSDVKRLPDCVYSPTSYPSTYAYIEHPNANAYSEGSKSDVKRPSNCVYSPASYPSTYAYIEHPNANAYSEEIPYETYLEGGRIVAKIAAEVYDMKPRAATGSKKSKNFVWKSENIGQCLVKPKERIIKSSQTPILPDGLEEFIMRTSQWPLTTAGVKPPYDPLDV